MLFSICAGVIDMKDASSSWYFSCGRCSAKWFAHEPRMACPRCSEPTLAWDRQIPPWKRCLTPRIAYTEHKFIHMEEYEP